MGEEVKFIERSNVRATFPVTDHVFVGELQSPPPGLSYMRRTELIGEFNGVNTFLDFVRQSMPAPLKSYYSASEKLGSEQFNSFANYAEAMDVYLNRPSEVRQFNEKDTVLDGGEGDGNSVEYDVTGDFIDISRYLEGIPESYGFMTSGNPLNRRVNIYINLFWVNWITADVINARAARIVRLIDWLESQQVRVMVLGVSSTQCTHFEIKIKDYDETLDINDLAVVSHGDFSRRAAFRFAEHSNTIETGYGNAFVFSNATETAAFAPEYASEYSLFIDSRVSVLTAVMKGFDAAEKWLETSLPNVNLEPLERTLPMFRSGEGQPPQRENIIARFMQDYKF